MGKEGDRDSGDVEESSDMSEERDSWSSITSTSSLPQNKRIVIEKDGGRDWNQDKWEWSHWVSNNQDRYVYGYEGMYMGMRVCIWV